MRSPGSPLLRNNAVCWAGVLALGAALGLSPEPARLPTQTRRRATARAQERGSEGLSGLWSGAYAYPAFWPAEPVPFNAVLAEIGGAISGSIDEPNTFSPAAVSRLFARVSGARNGQDVRFSKTYDGTGGKSHTIEYVGALSADGTRVDGFWAIGRSSGTFFMTRLTGASAHAEERSSSASA